MFKNIARFGNTGDYLPLFNGVLFTDLAVIALLNAGSINSRVLRKWYTDYNLSAVIADVLIILIGLIIVRAVYYHVFAEFSIWKFKDYANEVSFKAVFADGGMMILASLVASYLAGKSMNANIIVMVALVYVLPYLLYN